MISRARLARNAQITFKRYHQARLNNSRKLATAISETFNYETGTAAGVKCASRDLAGPTTTLAVVAKAGTRYQVLPGYTEGLEKFAFKSTKRRSALRITRETELLGSELFAYHSRENLVIGARFLRADLPYFAELIGEVISKTKFSRHELQDEVLPSIELDQKAVLGRPSMLAIDSAHGVAFHRGLGAALYPVSSTPVTKYLHEDSLEEYSREAFAKKNFSVVANGASQHDLGKWIGEFFADSPELPSKDTSPQSKYYGGEERIAHNSGNCMIIAFPGSSSFTGSSYRPEVSVLAALLGGKSAIKWSPGLSLLSKVSEEYPSAHIQTINSAYSDAGLLCISISGQAGDIRDASQHVMKVLKSIAEGTVSGDDIKIAKMRARFQALESGQNVMAGLEMTGAGLVYDGKAHKINEVAKGIDAVTADQIVKEAKQLLAKRATVSTVGDLHALPFAEEVGINI